MTTSLKKLSDSKLHQSTVRSTKAERAATADVLAHFLEVDRRRLYSVYKCKSLWDYAITYCGYTKDEAQTRISAMRVLKEIPDIETRIETGSLTITNLEQARALFNREKKCGVERSLEEKITVLKKLESATKFEARATLDTESKLQPLEFALDREAPPVTLEQFDSATQERLERLLEIYSRAYPSMTLRELIGEIAELAIEKLDPIKRADRAQARARKRQEANSRERQETKSQTVRSEATASIATRSPAPAAARSPKSAVGAPPAPARGTSQQAPAHANHRPHLSAALRHAVYLRDRGQCQQCSSQRFLEIDHVIPFAQGGTNVLGNLRLLCRGCNQRHAIEAYGLRKMQRYLREPVTCYGTSARN